MFEVAKWWILFSGIMIYETKATKQTFRSFGGYFGARITEWETSCVGYSIYEETSENCAKAKKDGH